MFWIACGVTGFFRTYPKVPKICSSDATGVAPNGMWWVVKQ